MQTQLELHSVQATILRELLFKQSARFTELNIKDLTSDHFTFHINKLVEAKLVEKTLENKYTLTISGKEFANRLDTDNAKMERQPKVCVSVICTKTEDEVTKYLIQKRLKQPYYGYYGVITGKIRWGETFTETAERELMEEAGLEGKLTLKGIKHKMDYDTDGKMLEDKIFFVHLAENCTGTLLEKFEGGENLWCSIEEIKRLPDLFPDVLLGIEIIESNNLQIHEGKYKVERY